MPKPSDDVKALRWLVEQSHKNIEDFSKSPSVTREVFGEIALRDRNYPILIAALDILITLLDKADRDAPISTDLRKLT